MIKLKGVTIFTVSMVDDDDSDCVYIVEGYGQEAYQRLLKDLRGEALQDTGCDPEEVFNIEAVKPYYVKKS